MNTLNRHRKEVREAEQKPGRCGGTNVVLDSEREDVMATKKNSKKNGTAKVTKLDPKVTGRSKGKKSTPKKPAVTKELLAKQKAAVLEAQKKLETQKKHRDKVVADENAEVAAAQESFRTALAPYRESCRKAGVTCEFEGRATRVGPKVKFNIVKVEKGFEVTIDGRPNTKTLFPRAELKKHPYRLAFAYTEKHLGPREEVGNKGGSLGYRLKGLLEAPAKK